jgi:site-specific DNA-methyltransferase (adenine-specific)
MKLTKDQIGALDDMLDRADAHGGDIASKVDADGKYIRTPWELCEEIVGQIAALSPLQGKKILVVDTVEFIPVLLAFGAEKCNITYVAPYEYKGAMIAGALGVRVVQQSLLEWKSDMKFDVVVGNPPYQSAREGTTATEDLSSKFVQKCISLRPEYLALVIPSDWTGPNQSTLKNTLFGCNLKKLCLYGNKWFNVAKDTCTIFLQKGYTGITEIVDKNNNSQMFDLKNKTTISLDNAQTQFLSKFEGHEKYLSDRWLHGSLYLNKAESLPVGDITFIKAVGRKDAPLTTQKIPTGEEMTGYGLHKLVMPMVGDSGKFGQIKFTQPTDVGGHSVVFLVTGSEEQNKVLKSYLESKLVRVLTASIKKSTPNSKGTFSMIPDIDLSRPWTDEEIYDHFGLTQEEIDYVEATIK